MQKIVPLNVEVVEEVLSRGDTSLRESDASLSLKSSHKDYNDMTTPNTKGTGVLQIQELSERQHNSIDSAGEMNVRRCSLNTKSPVVLWVNSESASSKEILSMKIEDLESKPNYSQGVYGEGGMCVDEAQKDESWYTLGYAIERMNFNLRVATDGSLIRNHANSDTCSGSEDELNRSGEECFDNINMEEEEGGMFLDHSLSQTLSHGGSPWTNNISSNKNEDDDESFQVNPKSNAIYSQESYMDTSLEFLEIGEKIDSGSQNKLMSKKNSKMVGDTNSHQSKLSTLEGKGVGAVVNVSSSISNGQNKGYSRNTHNKGSDEKNCNRNGKIPNPKKSSCTII
jgi:hypothetical protein